jgi:hypothetical protein
VPEVVQPDGRQTRSAANSVEVPVQAARLHRGPHAGREHQAVVPPDLPQLGSFPLLPVTMRKQFPLSDPWQRHRRIRRLRLGVVDDQLAVSSLHGLGHGERASVKVESGQRRTARRAWFSWLRRGAWSRRQLAGLTDAVAVRRDLHELGHVSGDQLVALGAAERVPQNGVDELDLPPGRVRPQHRPAEQHHFSSGRCRS